MLEQPASTTAGRSGRIDYLEGGADVFLRELLTLGILEDVCRTQQSQGRIFLRDSWALPWRRGRDWFLEPLKWFRQPLNDITRYYGHPSGFYFSFLGYYTVSLIIPSAIG